MEGKKFSLNSVISNSISTSKQYGKKIFASMAMQYVAFLLVYLFTRSLLISFVAYCMFLPSQVLFLTNLQASTAEDVFKLGKRFVTPLLISMLCVFVLSAGLVLFVVPAVFMFANYALVFEAAKNGDVPAMECFKQAQQKAKGYRGKLAWLFLSFLLILILFVGLGILLAWLFSLFIPRLTLNTTFIWSFITTPLFYYVGSFVGVSAFLIFVLPIELMAISNMSQAIEQDKLFKQQQADAQNFEPYKDVDNNSGDVNADNVKKIDDKDVEINSPDDDLDDRDDGNPSDYIF